MRVFVTGVSCVGKSTVAAKLADRLSCKFFDLDKEVERFFGTSIGRLHGQFLTNHSYREEASKALAALLAREDTRDCVVALPPSGLMGGYWHKLKESPGVVFVLNDKPQNIVERCTFYDIDSRPIYKTLTEQEKKHYIREIRGDMSYLRTTYKRADAIVEIAGLDADEASQLIVEMLNRNADGHCSAFTGTIGSRYRARGTGSRRASTDGGS